jgi:peptidoglycan/LPS O-acetylase OafA/YrhL
MAVQIFLVMGGYLAAMQWLPHPDAATACPAALPRALWQRYLRLVPACIVALGAAVLSAELARWLTGDPNLPPTPSWTSGWSTCCCCRTSWARTPSTPGSGTWPSTCSSLACCC